MTIPDPADAVPSCAAAQRCWRILLAAGSPLAQKLGMGLLRKQGHEVHLASTGPEAVEQSAAQEFDVVILDWWLPQLECPEVVRAIRQRKQAGRPLWILVMAEADEEMRERCRTAGADGMLHSPLRTEEFLDCISELQRRGQAGNQPQGTNSALLNAISWNEALEAVGGRRDLLLELVEMFFEEYPPTVDAIRAAIKQQDAKGLQLSAHKLKGCLRYFGNSEAAESSRLLEQMGRNGQLDGAGPLFERLTACLDQLLPGLRAGPP